ncbi:uncharacterized protein EDB93DRAFT_1109682 [Suillus bovinus]|uniref:uncharacterized protein n=1 Tax=Suillus bovinus TaxID=48563 RepID=UPI001B8851D1|nr:uncharacterized protein EDB93DRAFT_1109682 [Suillus bovinus]KAG2126348.1 hypothetical protein EDB93DRAFT_1109682 [Suillus bovinus]
MVSYPCSVCRATFDSARGLSNHKCGKCAQKEAGSITSIIKKRCQDQKRQLAAKVQRLDDEDAAIRAREAIRQQSAEALDDNEIPDFREPTPPPLVRTSGLPNRARRLPKRYQDILPPLPVLPQPPQQPAAGSRPWWSGFGTSMKTPTENFFVPFLNATIYRLMCWFHGGSTMKSLTELDRLVNEVILAEDFDKTDLQGFRASKELECLDNYQGDPEDICSSFSTADGWIETSVKI